LSVKTVSTYRSRILEKMGMKNTSELIFYAVKRGLVEQFSLPETDDFINIILQINENSSPVFIAVDRLNS